MRIMFIVNDLGINEPFGPMILSAVLKQKGHQTILGVLQKEDVNAKIDAWKPDLLAYSMMSVDMADMRKFNDELRKRKKIFSLLGGPHATLDRSCIDDPNIDAICLGEADEAIVEVVNNLEKGKSLDGIPNVMTSRDSKLVMRKLIEDLDALPFMDRELVYAYPDMARFGIKGIWTSRGCIFPCPYCFNNRYNALYKGKGKISRRRSVDSVIRETKELVSRYRVEFIRIQDDVFVYRADDWLREFSQRWAREIRKPFYCLLRSELITDEMADYLKQAGCASICMSIESGDDDVRNRMLRRKMDKEKLENAFRIFKKHKINVYANSMLALPFTTHKHDLASVDFAIKVKPEMPNFGIFMPFPGTDLGDYCKQAGIYKPEDDPLNYGMRNASPLTCFSEKEKEVQGNLCQLAIVAVKFPVLRNLIVNRLIYWKPNKLFFYIHYFFAVTSYGRKIFYYNHTLGEYFELIVRTLKAYFYDFFSKNKQDIVGKKGNAGQTTSVQNKNRYDRMTELEKCMESMARNTFVES